MSLDTIETTVKTDVATLVADAKKYAIIVKDDAGKVLFSIENKPVWGRFTFALRAIGAIFTGKTLVS